MRVIDQKFKTDEHESSSKDVGETMTGADLHASAIDWSKVILHIPPMDLPIPEPCDAACLNMICELCDPCDRQKLQTSAICIGRYDGGNDKNEVHDIPVIVCPTCAKYVKKIEPASIDDISRAKPELSDESLAVLEQKQLDEAVRLSLHSLSEHETEAEEDFRLAVARSLEQVQDISYASSFDSACLHHPPR